MRTGQVGPVCTGVPWARYKPVRTGCSSAGFLCRPWAWGLWGPCARGLGSVGTGWAEISLFVAENGDFFDKIGEILGMDDGEKMGESEIHLKPRKSMDQIQQNIIKTNKSQKKLGLFLVGNFRI